MDETAPEPGRRTALLLLGAGVLAPAVVVALGAGGRGGEADSLRFDVLSVARRALAGHVAHGDPVALADAPSWPDVVRVELRVHNLAGMPLMVSPGQFRLRVGGITVMPTAWRHGPAALPGGTVRTGWIDYRAPAGAGLLELEFTAAGGLHPVAVRLGAAGDVR